VGPRIGPLTAVVTISKEVAMAAVPLLQRASAADAVNEFIGLHLQMSFDQSEAGQARGRRGVSD